ncbi:hypothetical protein EYF80_004395 [Liparis tanakae]|uniref:Uncharacterized protein n=1 Tax=Liparis tanakae TaxID=230148 RepID=A0A4Z2J726_9TELE|nr:hypothetical protein EYF80_004395 [Liparis tanakae]
MGPWIQLRLLVLETQELQSLYLLWTQEDLEHQDVPSDQTDLLTPLLQGSQPLQVFHLRKVQKVQGIHANQVHLWHPLVRLSHVRHSDQGGQGYLVSHGHLRDRVYQLESSQGVREDLKGLVGQYIPGRSLQEVQRAPLVLAHLARLEDLAGLQRLGNKDIQTRYPHKDVPENPKEDICARSRLSGSQKRHKLEVMILATVAEPGIYSAALQHQEAETMCKDKPPSEILHHIHFVKASYIFNHGVEHLFRTLSRGFCTPTQQTVHRDSSLTLTHAATTVFR